MARRGSEEYLSSGGGVSGGVSGAYAKLAATAFSRFRGCAGYYTSLETEKGALLIIYLFNVKFGVFVRRAALTSVKYVASNSA